MKKVKELFVVVKRAGLDMGCSVIILFGAALVTTIIVLL